MSSKTVKISRNEDAPYIEVTLGAKKGSQFRLFLDIMSVGRGDDNDIILASESVSRCHFFLKKTPKSWLLQDNRSRNGVLLNGKKVTEAPIASGDKIQAGEFTFRFVDPKATQALKASLRVEVPRNVGPQGLPVTRPRRKPPGPNLDPQQVFYLVVGVTVGLVLASLTAMRLSKVRTSKISPPGVAKKLPSSPSPEEVLRDSELATEKTGDAPLAVSRDEMKVKPKRKGPRNDKADLLVYLKEGKDYLQEGDFDSASMAFRFALVIDPQNPFALDGLRMIEERKTRTRTKAAASAPIAQAPAGPTPQASRRDRSPSKADLVADKRKMVNDLLKIAQTAFSRRSYQEAINTAEKIRRIEIKNETLYLNEAKQIIDKARFRQKEDVEPFLDQARQRLAAGDFKAGKDLCEEMVRMDPAYQEAKECLNKAEEGLRANAMKGYR